MNDDEPTRDLGPPRRRRSRQEAKRMGFPTPPNLSSLRKLNISQWGKIALWVVFGFPAALIWLAFVYHLMVELFS